MTSIDPPPRKDNPSEPERIAYLIEDGKMLDARAALVLGQTQLTAAILTIDVITKVAQRAGCSVAAAALTVRSVLTRGT